MTEIPSVLFWLDQSEAAQRLARNLLDDLRIHQARDELGLGTIRDIIADALSPGTSTIMTRARYYFFTSWIYCDIERSSDRGAAIDREVEKREKLLLHKLNQKLPRDESGVIGRRITEDTLPQRLPSEIYWAGLRRLGFFRSKQSGASYHRLLGSPRHGESDEDAEEREPTWDAGIPTVVSAHKAAEEDGFDLSRKEADYLLERIGAARKPRQITGDESLLWWLVEDAPSSLLETGEEEGAWLRAMETPNRKFLVEATERARWLSRQMHGAQLLYNSLVERTLREFDPEHADELGLHGSVFSAYLERWSHSLWRERDWFAARTQDWFWSWPPLIEAATRATTRRFVDAWSTLVLGEADSALNSRARLMVEARERTLKGTQSRLAGFDRERMRLYRGEAGAGALDFRWGVTRRIALDIRKGRAAAP